MRHEKEADFSIFETDIFDKETAQLLSRVIEKLTWSRQTPGVHGEYEFSLYEGAIHVGRCHWIAPTDRMESQSSKSLPRRLDIESLGSIDTLRWTPFEDPELKGGEVEIDMHYVGLNFRVSPLPPPLSTYRELKMKRTSSSPSASSANRMNSVSKAAESSAESLRGQFET
jgi:hypothetical protein